MTLSTQVIASAFEQRAHGLSDAMRQKARMHIADNVAISVAAREASPLAQIVRKGCASAAPQGAEYAFAASAYGHIMDFDDIHDMARVHPTAVNLPAALAVAGPDTTGAEVVDAVSLSNELLCRLGAIWKPQGRGPGSDWFLTQLFGYFSGALSAGIIMRLDAAQIRSAFGLAYMQAAGGKEAGFGTGSNARAIYPAFAAMGGVQAALLARAGMIGPATALDGEAGFFRIYFGRHLDADQTRQLLAPTVSVWADTEVKPWPSCRFSHPFISAALHLRAGLDLSDIERVTVSVNKSAAKLCSPIEERRVPQTLQDAKYSIPFMVAFTLVRGEVSLRTLNDAALSDPAALSMAQRVNIVDSGTDEAGLPQARIEVQMKSGAVKLFDQAYQAPPGDDAARAKFDACFEYAGYAPEETEAAWSGIMDLDRRASQPLQALMAIARK